MNLVADTGGSFVEVDHGEVVVAATGVEADPGAGTGAGVDPGA
jgi:hypothetical protein